MGEVDKEGQSEKSQLLFLVFKVTKSPLIREVEKISRTDICRNRGISMLLGKVSLYQILKSKKVWLLKVLFKKKQSKTKTALNCSNSCTKIIKNLG